MKRLIILFAAVLCGCEPAMTNEQIIAEVKKCEDAGLKAARLINMMDFRTRGIECVRVYESD